MQNNSTSVRTPIKFTCSTRREVKRSAPSGSLRPIGSHLLIWRRRTLYIKLGMDGRRGSVTIAKGDAANQLHLDLLQSGEWRSFQFPPVVSLCGYNKDCEVGRILTVIIRHLRRSPALMTLTRIFKLNDAALSAQAAITGPYWLGTLGSFLRASDPSVRWSEIISTVRLKRTTGDVMVA